MNLSDTIKDFEGNPVTDIIPQQCLAAIVMTVENGVKTGSPAVEMMQAIASVIIDYRNAELTYRRAVMDALGNTIFVRELSVPKRHAVYCLCVKLATPEMAELNEGELELIRDAVAAHWLLPIVIGRVYDAFGISPKEEPAPEPEAAPIKKLAKVSGEPSQK